MPRKIADNSPPEERLINAGRELFFSRGFAGVSTDEIAKAASTSKATLYKYFDGPSGLLATVVKAEAIRFEEGRLAEPTTLGGLKAALTDYGTALLSFLNDPEIIRFSQTMHEEARAHPETARLFFDAAYGNTKRGIAQMIQHCRDSGGIAPGLPAQDLAEMLLGMWECTKFIETTLGISKKPFPEPKIWAAQCVEQFCRGLE